MNSSTCFGQRRARAVRGDRVEPERDGDLELAVGEQVVGAAVLVDLPVHRGRALVEHLHAVHADVAARRCAGRCVITAGSVMNGAGVARPAGLDRQAAEVDLVAGRGRPPARRRCGRVFGCESAIDFSFFRPRTFSASPCGGCISSTSPSCAADVVERVGAEGEAHPPLGAELVDQQRVLEPFGFSNSSAGPPALTDAVDDLRDLEVRIDLGGDAHELALALEERDPVAEVAWRRHRLQ